MQRKPVVTGVADGRTHAHTKIGLTGKTSKDTETNLEECSNDGPTQSKAWQQVNQQVNKTISRACVLLLFFKSQECSPVD